MPSPNVNALPIAPARLSRPSNFVTESTMFLDSLPSFRTQVNQLSSYINANIANKLCFGTIWGVRDFPTISQSTLYGIEYDDNNIEFTISLDSLYLTLQDYSLQLNSVGDWYDRVLSEVGSAPYDLDKPLISGVTVPMTRLQSRVAFNTAAALFSESSIDNINSLYQSIWYSYITSCSNEDYGLITDGTIISYIECGDITDTNLTY